DARALRHTDDGEPAAQSSERSAYRDHPGRRGARCDAAGYSARTAARFHGSAAVVLDLRPDGDDDVSGIRGAGQARVDSLPGRQRMSGESGRRGLEPRGFLAIVVLATLGCLAAVDLQARLPRLPAGRYHAVGQAPAAEDPDELYRRRQELPAARRPADLWAARASMDYDAAWKLARVCDWLGTAGAPDERRRALERGVKAGESAARLEPNRPEGHFWYAANMGNLAQLFGASQGLKYRGRIKE